MKPNQKQEMNRIAPPLQRSYRSTFGSLILASCAVLALGAMSVFSSSCAGGGLKIPAALPFDVGVRYQVEPGLFVVATPDEKGGLDITFDGKGDVNEHLSFDGTAWTYNSPDSGIVYRITQGLTGRPKIEIIGGGNGKLQLVPKTPPPSDPVLTEPADPPPVATPVPA